ncbi:hypothetical protein Vadar_019954 [Vaccinium darrowii]|nr:hypothetical protein Vadar_019954 [Vaccinium darrowii]
MYTWCPGDGTALHAATFKESIGQSTKKLLIWKNDLINLPDAYGRIPLHYAACNGNKEAVKELLAFDNSGVYISTTHNDGRDTALHIAAAHGHVPVIEELLSRNPDCWEMVNSKGQNILHIAVDMNMESVIKFIVNQPWFRHLINQKDNEGNTPLHLLIASDCNVGELWKHGKADQHAFNDKSMTPVDLVWSNFKEEKMSTFATTYIVDDTFLASGISGGRTVDCNAHDNLAKLERARKKRLLTKVAETDKQKKAKDKDTNERFQRSMSLFQTLVIVAALITTITFTAAFTIPGGYYGDQGGDKEAAFTAFFITNTIAMVCSVTSILLCFYAMLHVIAGNDADSGGVHLYSIALVLILVSIFVLMLAFISATFAVLARSKELVVATCIITVIPFTALFFKIIKMCF